jgi:metal transporter CNNM
MADASSWIAIVVLVMLSATFSGLTLGLLSLDTTSLKITAVSGTPSAVRYAQRILPLRQRGNLLLTTLLLGNVAVNSLLSILMADLTSGIVGFLVSTGVIVIFGEIFPQALCSRQPLAIGYYAVPLVYVVMGVVFPLAFPIAKLLDVTLGVELGTVYTKRELSSLILAHATPTAGTLQPAEAAVLQSALSFSAKKVAAAMTPLDRVFTVATDDVCDRRLVARITDTGYSRVPVRDAVTNKFVGVLHVKDLAHFDPDDATSVRDIIGRFPRPLVRVLASRTLDTMLPLFREAHSHMALVYSVDSTSLGADPVPTDIGIITLEDVIEELIGQEIVDETDVAAGERAATGGTATPADVSAREIMAIDSFLAVSRPHIFGRLLPRRRRAMLRTARFRQLPEGYKIYVRSAPATMATIILSGRVDVTSGADGFLSVAGPFSVLGIRAVTHSDVIASFTAVCDEPTRIVQISYEAYQTALLGSGADTSSENESDDEFLRKVVDARASVDSADASLEDEPRKAAHGSGRSTATKAERPMEFGDGAVLLSSFASASAVSGDEGEADNGAVAATEAPKPSKKKGRKKGGKKSAQ